MSKASNIAYVTIREKIISGELAPGDQVREEALADICGVSRTPVREAMRKLEAELLIVRSESQRSYVADWSLDDIEDAFELRALLEGVAARRAAARIDSDGLARLERANAALDHAIQKSPPDVIAFLEANKEFHAEILAVAGSRRLEILLQSLIEQPIIWRTGHHYSADELKRSHHEHAELIKAIERRDGAWAETIMAGHIRRAFHVYADAHRSMLASDDSREKRRA